MKKSIKPQIKIYENEKKFRLVREIRLTENHLRLWLDHLVFAPGLSYGSGIKAQNMNDIITFFKELEK